MLEPSVIFQRTNAGREEIKQKSHGLTQSERLVLIMVDGVTPYRDLRAKLPVLTEERFNRALIKLQKKELVLEVMLEPDVAMPDEIEKTVIDRFLQQDPQDPLTILLLDTDEYDEEWHFAPAMGSETPKPAPPAFDRAHIELADEVAEEVKALQAARTPRLEPIEVAEKNVEAQERARLQERPSKIHGLVAQWPYLTLAIGLAFIAGFALARYFG
jgi:hypothetical protein